MNVRMAVVKLDRFNRCNHVKRKYLLVIWTKIDIVYFFAVGFNFVQGLQSWERPEADESIGSTCGHAFAVATDADNFLERFLFAASWEHHQCRHERSRLTRCNVHLLPHVCLYRVHGMSEHPQLLLTQQSVAHGVSPRGWFAAGRPCWPSFSNRLVCAL